jgi:hypothetical protein
MKIRVCLVLSFLLIPILNGCTTAPPIPLTSHHIGSTPELNSYKLIDVGEVIYEEYDVTLVDLVRLEASYGYNDDHFEKGTLLTGYLISDAKFYCANRYSSPYPNMSVYASASMFDLIKPCFRDTDFDGKFDKIKSSPSREIQLNAALRNKPLPYTTTNGQQKYAKGFKKQLLYQGVVNNGINISYREFSDNMARPAFTQEVKYELDSSGKATLGFQGARIEVYNASNTGLSYKVINGFGL